MINQALLPTLWKASFVRHAMKPHSQPHTSLVFQWIQLQIQQMLMIHPHNSDKLRLTKVLTNSQVDERIGLWNVVKKQYKEVEYVAEK
jgi:hypothetical protein